MESLTSKSWTRCSASQSVSFQQLATQVLGQDQNNRHCVMQLPMADSMCWRTIGTARASHCRVDPQRDGARSLRVWVLGVSIGDVFFSAELWTQLEKGSMKLGLAIQDRGPPMGLTVSPITRGVRTVAHIFRGWPFEYVPTPFVAQQSRFLSLPEAPDCNRFVAVLGKILY
jgi:hypothetical protein